MARMETAPLQELTTRELAALRHRCLLDALDALDARGLQVLPHDLRVLREGDLGLFDLRVPLLLPLEAVVALVSALGQHADLLLHRDLARAREHVPPVRALRDRILQVRVAHPLAERGPGV